MRALLAIALVASPAVAHADKLPPPRQPSTFKVCIVPLGPHDGKLLPVIKRGVEHLYGFTVEIRPRHALPQSAYYKPRRRYRAEKLLNFLDALPERKSCQAIMGYTRRDISTTKGKHVDWGILGLGTIGGPSGVVSSYRMRHRRRRTVMRRAVNVFNHELGHVLGLPHFNGAKGCLMNDAKGTVRTVDAETGLLCAHSHQKIVALHNIALPNLTRFDWKRVLGR